MFLCVKCFFINYTQRFHLNIKIPIHLFELGFSILIITSSDVFVPEFLHYQKTNSPDHYFLIKR